MLVPTWVGISVVVFSLLHLIPGDPATVILGMMATPEQREAVLSNLGLDKPLFAQFFGWLGSVVSGDLGNSVINGQPVAEQIVNRTGPSLELVLMAVSLSVVVGVPFGVWTATHPGRFVNFIVHGISLLGLSIPTFLLGSLLIVLGSRVAKDVQMIGYIPFAEDPVASVRVMFWPALTLALALLAIVVRYTREAMASVLGSDYMMTARAMGVPRRALVYKNAFRNSLVPMIGAVGAQVAYLVGGAVVVETVFAIPGIGTLTLSAIDQRDYPVLQGIVLVVATGVIVVNLLVDLLYVVVDPRMADA